MRSIPLIDDQCAVVRNILKSVLDALQEGDGRYDAGDRVVVNISKADVDNLHRVIKKL